MGCVYILKNPAMPDLIKIGYTMETAQKRADELSRSTGVPMPFEVAVNFAQLELEQCKKLEKEMHPAEGSSLSLGGTFSQAGGDLNIGFQGGVPLDFMNGHVAWFAQRDTSGEVVLSETLQAHLEGAAGYHGWELVVFINGLRDIDRELQEAKLGYAVEVPEVSIGGWQGTVGAGNAARSREAVAASTGLAGKALDAAVVSGGQSLHWFGYMNLHHPSGWDFSLKSLHDLNMRNPEITGTLATSWNLGRGFSFDIAYQGIYEWERREYFGTFLGAITWEL